MAERIIGIDVSYCQKGLDYAKVKEAGVKVALIRAGCWYNKDSVCDANVKGCEENGIDYGFYWFSYALTVEQAKNEAQKCLSVIKNYNPTYPIYYDMEDESQMVSSISRKTRTDMALAFAEIIAAAGYKAGFYVNPNWLENYLDKKRLLSAGYELWLAAWTWDPNKPTKYDYGQKIWQWGSSKLAGKTVDGDIIYFDYAKADAPASVEKSIDQLADEVLDGKWGNGKDRYERLTAAGYSYTDVQLRVNEKLAAQTKKKTVDELAAEVLNGKWGNGAERRNALTAAGYDYIAVQSRVNELVSAKNQAKAKTVDELAREVIAGEWGVNPERKERLTDAGYDYSAVQKRVNEMLKALK